jgi:7-carboxy-7-deazaguanine synthase
MTTALPIQSTFPVKQELEEAKLDEKKYPVAEIFQSPQGEGQWQGSLMTFVRLAGCNVGKPFTQVERDMHYAEGNALKVYQEKCVCWSNAAFACDTDYRVTHSKRMTPDEILRECEGVYRVIITGGEPLIHDLLPLLRVFRIAGKKVHLETSGTRPLTPLRAIGFNVWVAVSPKKDYLVESLILADEIKVLVGPDFSEVEFEKHFIGYMDKVWLQPINYENDLNMKNVEHCLAIQRKYPITRLSIQSHKILRVR